MYQDLKKIYWWKMMKVDVAKYVASCGVCQRVKAEHKSFAGKLQFLEVRLQLKSYATMLHGTVQCPLIDDEIDMMLRQVDGVLHCLVLAATQ